MADVPTSTQRQKQETAYEYDQVVARLNPEWRVIVCSEQLQYIAPSPSTSTPWPGASAI